MKREAAKACVRKNFILKYLYFYKSERTSKRQSEGEIFAKKSDEDTSSLLSRKGVSRFPRGSCFTCKSILSGAHVEKEIRPYIGRVTIRVPTLARVSDRALSVAS